MKKSELKKLLKPVIKEMLLECIMESGLLSEIIAESVKGFAKANVLVESRQLSVPAESSEPSEEELERMRFKRAATEKTRLDENKKRMLESIGLSAYGGVDVFEGTAPAPEPGPPVNDGSNGVSMGSAANALRDMDPNDPGIDISMIPGVRLK